MGEMGTGCHFGKHSVYATWAVVTLNKGVHMYLVNSWPEQGSELSLGSRHIGPLATPEVTLAGTAAVRVAQGHSTNHRDASAGRVAPFTPGQVGESLRNTAHRLL